MAGMGFPLNASFRPYLVLRNATGRALPVALRLNWMEGEAPRTLPLPTQVLAPAATRRVHLGQFMDRAGLGDFDGSVNLLLSFNGRAGELVPAAGSMDETHNYVFEVPPQGAAPTSGREAITWQLRAGFDTMLTLWNWGEKAEDVVATFYYGDGTGKYELPEHLAAGASATIDLMQLAESGQPDASGQTFSMSPGYGSATIETADGKHGWMDLAEAAGVYNPVTATCGVVCVTCCGYGSVGIDPNPLILRLQADGYPVADGEYSDGTMTDFSGTWSSSDTRIATVAAGGPPVQGVAVGQADVTAYLTNVPVNAGQICAATDPSCPPPYNPEPTGGVAVTPVITSISPARGPVSGTVTVTIDGSGFGTGGETVSAGSGIAVTVNSTSNTQIQASFQISSTAAGGNAGVTVTVSGQVSNSANFYVQIPSRLSIIAGTDSTTSETTCSAGSFGTGCGVTRSFVYQVEDQESPPQPIDYPGLQVWDSFGTPSPNGLDVTSFNTTCTPANTGPCNVTTNAQGEFGENAPGLSVCSTVCYAGGSCTTGGPTTVAQTYHVGPSSIVQTISYFCQNITVNGQ